MAIICNFSDCFIVRKEIYFYLLYTSLSFHYHCHLSASIKGSTIAKIWKGAKPVFLNFSNIRTLPPCHYDLRTLTLD